MKCLKGLFVSFFTLNFRKDMVRYYVKEKDYGWKEKVGDFLQKTVPIGFEDFKEIIDKDKYYVDKTMMLHELLECAGKINLYTRPRRFGKTLNLSMIRRFFEEEMNANGEKIENGYLFEGLKITECDKEYITHQESYPVINLSLKSGKQPTYEMSVASLVDEIAKEFKRHRYVLSSDKLTANDRERFTAMMNYKAETIEYAKALEFLSACLTQYHGNRTIILIDEYDVPLENAHFEGFYDKMIGFIRSLFESALKTNINLEFAVITGCLRISRESIFTGLNNLDIYSIMTPRYADAFGFTEEEVKEMLSFYNLEDKTNEVKNWYDGYQFGKMEIYNPWSIINYVNMAISDREAYPQPYWSNTSSNNIVKELVENADSEMRQEIENLIAGGTIKKPMHEDITYDSIHESQDNLWNFLYFTGYLKAGKESFENDTRYMELTIPNREVRTIYKRTILTWFDKKMKNMERAELIQALEAGDCKLFERLVSEQLLDTISFFDYAENYYHGFLAELLKGAGKYLVTSNRESGIGRPDLILKTPSVRGGAIILELKVSDTFQGMEQECQNALKQIEEADYEAGLRAEGYSNIKKYGVCFYRKECMVRK